MKLFIFAILAVMLVGTTAIAAEVPTSEGDKAFFFDFDGLADLDLDGPHHNGVGLRYYIADNTAIRGVVIFGSDSYTEESDIEGYADYENNWKAYGLEAMYEKHLDSMCASVVPYWGIGAGFEMFSDEYVMATGSGGDTYTETDKGTAFYGMAAMGFEWAFTDCLTLGGEYQLGFWSGSSETETDSESRTETCCKVTDTWMGFDEASVFLSVYW
jgi:outer membrane protein W